MGHIPVLVTKRIITMACGKVVSIPKGLQNKMPSGPCADKCQNPESADCLTCNRYVTL